MRRAFRRIRKNSFFSDPSGRNWFSRDFTLHSTRKDRDGIVVLAIGGDLTMDTYPMLKDTFQELLSADARGVVLNLSEATMVGSSAIGALVAFLREVENRGGNLALAAPSPMLLQVLDLLKLTDFFAIDPGEDDAVDALKDAGDS